MLAGAVLEKAFLAAIVGSAGQAGEPDEEGDFLVGGLRGHVQVEGHLAAGGFGLVGAFQELAAEAGDGGFGGNGHCRS